MSNLTDFQLQQHIARTEERMKALDFHGYAGATNYDDTLEELKPFLRERNKRLKNSKKGFFND